ncbi:hypothetical protein PIB30_038649 [Stylosanthes scabra]|uniref:Uncharacterized protein n=1 Tax=Stylosanthes scabra TaxID=79078 RepID=A0ABU6WCL9_9FABA|nr:hypothetical protein [Stylosanthes scabra]
MVAAMAVSPWWNAIEMAEMTALLDTISLSTLSHPSLLNTLCSAHHRRRAAVPHATVDLHASTSSFRFILLPRPSLHLFSVIVLCPSLHRPCSPPELWLIEVKS